MAPNHEQAKANKLMAEMKKKNKGLYEVGKEAERSIAKLMSQGYNKTKAEDIVLELLKESEVYLRQGMYGSVILTLRMIFSDVEIDASNINLILK
jgi:hypothetical protein